MALKVVWTVGVLLQIVAAVDYSFTAILDAGEEQCFYEDIKPGKDVILDVEFQVVTGGNLDVDYTVKNPRGQYVDRGIRAKDGVFEKENPIAGVWEVRLVAAVIETSSRHYDIVLHQQQVLHHDREGRLLHADG